MESINQTLFLALNASPASAPVLIFVGQFFARYAIWVVPIVFSVAWLAGTPNTRKILLIAIAAMLVGALLSFLLGLILPHPRPFVVGLGHTHMAHADTPSFPSSHVTLLLSAAFCMLMHRSVRSLGKSLVILSFAIGWARIYVGVHLPLDMLGATLVAVFSTIFANLSAQLYLPITYALSERIHSAMFSMRESLNQLRK